ncbi:hypothetical protein STBA_29840 [Streptomyces sp. MP131-18]|nr:hypothetical protein STBA_29840 [Streptomyces sp. MP131-18]
MRRVVVTVPAQRLTHQPGIVRVPTPAANRPPMLTHPVIRTDTPPSPVHRTETRSRQRHQKTRMHHHRRRHALAPGKPRRDQMPGIPGMLPRTRLTPRLPPIPAPHSHTTARLARRVEVPQHLTRTSVYDSRTARQIHRLCASSGALDLFQPPAEPRLLRHANQVPLHPRQPRQTFPPAPSGNPTANRDRPPRTHDGPTKSDATGSDTTTPSFAPRATSPQGTRHNRPFCPSNAPRRDEVPSIPTDRPPPLTTPDPPRPRSQHPSHAPVPTDAHTDRPHNSRSNPGPKFLYWLKSTRLPARGQPQPPSGALRPSAGRARAARPPHRMTPLRPVNAGSLNVRLPDRFEVPGAVLGWWLNSVKAWPRAQNGRGDAGRSGRPYLSVSSMRQEGAGRNQTCPFDRPRFPSPPGRTPLRGRTSQSHPATALPHGQRVQRRGSPARDSPR